MPVSTETDAYPMPTAVLSVPAANAEEEQDRAAIEAVWAQVWDVYTRINQIPASDRPAAVESIMIDPLRSQLLSSAEKSDQAGLRFYGTIGLHPYWYESVDGRNTAVIGDCRDTSAFGEEEVATGNKTTVGVKGSNTVGKFVQTADGIWHLWDVVYINEIPCQSS